MVRFLPAGEGEDQQPHLVRQVQAHRAPRAATVGRAGPSAAAVARHAAVVCQQDGHNRAAELDRELQVSAALWCPHCEHSNTFRDEVSVILAVDGTTH